MMKRSPAIFGAALCLLLLTNWAWSSEKQAKGAGAPVQKSKTATEPQKKFVPEATVVLDDGTTLELAEFAFYSSHWRRGSYFVGQTYSKTLPGLPFVQGYIWTTIPFSEIERLECSPVTKHVIDWLTAVVTLTSGKQLVGRVPSAINKTWFDGDVLGFVGKSRVLGVEGDFSTGLYDVKSLVRSGSAPNSFTITESDGKATLVSNLGFEASGGLDYQLVTRHSVRRAEGSSGRGSDFDVTIGNTKVTLDLAKIESLVFTRCVLLHVKIKMKTGEEAEGYPEHLASIYGKTESGQLWFAPICKVRTGPSDEDKLVLRSVRFK